jgi:hypothetical protein
MSDGLCLLINDGHGIFIPQAFAENFAKPWSYISEQDLTILKEGPHHPEYWDAWSDVMGSAFLLDTEGKQWHLWQDGDLWAFCPELMTDEEYENFFGEVRL